jgi:hypothetical protein
VLEAGIGDFGFEIEYLQPQGARHGLQAASWQVTKAEFLTPPKRRE